MTVPTEIKLRLSTASPFSAATDFGELNCYFAGRALDELLGWSLATFGEKVAQVTSFGPAGMVILDHLARLNPGMRVITLDTGFLFAETYALLETIQARYPIRLEVVKPPLSPEDQARAYGPDLWRSNPDLCCHLRKVLPLGEAMAGLDAWLTGLRRDQSASRAGLPLIGWDARYHLVKINPLAGWSRGQVWAYLLEHQVPYNPLHDQGYSSIGCTHCTRPNANPADERAGRWADHAKTECGLHL